MASTNKFDSNRVFDLGRRYGFQGRIYNHAIIVDNNLLIRDNFIKGWGFVPQEGNTLLSTIEAFLMQTNNKDRFSVFKNIKKDFLYQRKW